MKEYHAINILEGIFEDCVRDDDKEYIEKNLAFAEAVKALSEIQQYRAIGTVEECREARERWLMKKGIIITNLPEHCRDCDFYGIRCRITNEMCKYYSESGRPEGCPIREVPERILEECL